MSICLTNIASMTAWTCNLVNNTTGDFIWDFGFQGTYEGSNFSDGDNWENWSFDVVESLNESVCDCTPILDLELMLGSGFFCGTVLVLNRLLLNYWCINLLEGFRNDGIIE